MELQDLSPADQGLLRAAGIGDPEGLERSLSIGANPLAADMLGRTALILATCGASSSIGPGGRHARCAEILLAHAPELAAVDNIGLTALMFAAGLGHEDRLRLLLPHSDPLALDPTGRSALSLARERGRGECAKLILEEIARREAAAIAQSCLAAQSPSDAQRL